MEARRGEAGEGGDVDDRVLLLVTTVGVVVACVVRLREIQSQVRLLCSVSSSLLCYSFFLLRFFPLKL